MNKNIHRPEAYLEPCQASKIELFTKMVGYDFYEG